MYRRDPLARSDRTAASVRRSRRSFLTLVGMSAPLFLVRCDAVAPRRTADIPRIGFLSPFAPSDPILDSALDDFRQGLGDFGYREGDTVRVEYRHGGTGAAEVLGPLAVELIGLPELGLFVPATGRSAS